jgi:membrane-bound lytic murein transglycosylase B
MGKSCRLLLALVLLLLAAPALAAPCGGDFNAFLAAIARDAQGQGVSRAVIDRAFAGLTPDPAVLAFDRRQRGMFHAKSFEEYAATRVIPARISRARKLMQVHAALLGRIEQQFGVPAPVIVAVWTLESDNGTGDMGKLPVIRTVATLAHDCRRTELFQRELIAALQIVQRGDLPLHDLIVPMPARSARHSFCLRRTSSTASTTTATAMSICAIPSQMCWPRPPICSRPTAGGPARRLPRARRISR